jgi:branched-chain amino acid transport system permease protein
MTPADTGARDRRPSDRPGLSGRPPWRRFTWPLVWLGFVVALVAIGLGLESLALLSMLTTVFMFVALAQAWNILGGYGGYLNLGMGAFFGLGAYTSAILNHEFGWSPFVTPVLGGLTAVVLALVIGVPSLRIRGVYFAILTLILTFLMQRLAFNVPFTRGALGIFLPPLELDRRQTEQLFFFVFLGLAVASVVIVWSIERSRFGAALVAISEDEDAAEVLGVRTTRTKINAFVLGAFMAGIVGAFYAQRVTFIDPDAAFDLHVSIDPVLIAMYGGAGTWQGPLIGAPLVVVLGEILRVTFGGLGFLGRTGVPAEMARLIFGLVLIVVALFARQGIMGLIKGRRGSRVRV